MGAELYVGFFVADGKVQDLCLYPSRECAADTIRDSVARYNGRVAITQIATGMVDDDGSFFNVVPVEMKD